ncbi:MAG: polyprenyl synthetase family protein [Desulfobacteraceae bacterium]
MTDNLKNRIIEIVREDLALIEEALKRNLNSRLDLVSDIAGHLLFGKGKRLRPLLTITGARMCGYDNAFSIDFSTVFEYLHAATLLHDDVVDGAEMRRGKQAAHYRWQTPKVILTGDFLLARSLNIASKTGLPEIINVISRITEEMAQGEIDQLDKKGRLDLSEKEYMDIINRKTAVLIRGACRSGAILAGAPEAEKTALSNYGYHLGIAFQMADDLLDYTADAETLGKNPGADLREGKLTLPLIKALETANADDKEAMERMIRAEKLTVDIFTNLVSMLDRYGGIEYTGKKAAAHVNSAKEAIEIFEDSGPKQLLTMLADYAVERKV